MMNFSQIPKESIPDVWAALIPFIQKAIDRSDGEMNLDDVYIESILGTSQLWAVHDGFETKAIGVTRIILFPQKKICRVVLFSGNGLKQMLPLWPKFEAWAIKEGCESIEWFGRKGFVKVMKQYGYEAKYVVMRKHLIKETIH